MSTLNAITSGAGGVALSGDTSGNLTIQSAGTNVATITASGLTMNTGNIVQSSSAAPAFSVTCGVTQSLSTNTLVIVQFTSKDFDTASCFNTSTYRFTPNVAGYYQFTFNALGSGAYGSGEVYGYIVKNSTGALVFDIQATNIWTMCGSYMFYANGTTDYFTCQIAQTSGSTKTISTACNFQGFLARSA